MKKVLTITLRLLVIIVSVAFNFVINTVHEWSVTTYNLMPELIVSIAYLILSAILLAISILMFPLRTRKEIVINITVILIGLVIGFGVLNLVGVPCLTVFVCSTYSCYNAFLLFCSYDNLQEGSPKN